MPPKVHSTRMKPLTLYHRTSIGQASEAVRAGFRDEDWTFGIRDSRSRDGGDMHLRGVWLTDRPLHPMDGPPGDALVEVTVDLAESSLETFEIEGIFHDTRLWVIPAELLNPHAQARIKEVDPNTSWQFDAGAGPSQDLQ